MRSQFVRFTALGALLLIPLAAPAQDPRPQRPVYSAEELDNLVAPVALYADKLLAQVLVAATFPEQLAVAASYVRTRGAREIDQQDWDPSVRAIAHYPPVLNMLAKDEDWAAALGQAYAAQPTEVLDAVQRLRQMAREQGNLETTPEQVVRVEREYIYIEPPNPEVIYVPTYEPYYVYAYPLYYYPHYRSYFSYGIGFPIGPWLSFGCDWYAGRVYYHGWHGQHWGKYAGVVGYYGPPTSRYIRPNPGVYTKRVNYANLDRDFRSVRGDVSFSRHSKPAGAGISTGAAGNGDSRVGSFSGVRRDGSGVGGTRYVDPASRGDFGMVSKPGGASTRREGPAVVRGSKASGTTFSSTTRPTEGKSRSTDPVVYRGGRRTSSPTFTSTIRTSNGKNVGSRPIERGSRVQSPTRSSGGQVGSGGTMVYRGGVTVPTFNSQGRPVASKGGVTGGQVYYPTMRAASGGSSRATFSGARSSSSFGSTTTRSSGMTGATVRPSGGGAISGSAVRITGFGGGRRPD